MRSEEYALGYVVLKGADGAVLAVVRCEIDPTVEIGEIPDVEFTLESLMKAVQVGASLVNVSDDPKYRNYKAGNAPLFLLTYTQENQPLSIKIPATVKKHTVSPEMYKSYIRVNDRIFDDEFFVNGMHTGIEIIDGGVTIYIDMPEDKRPKKVFQGFINFTNESNDIIFVLICKIDLN